MTTARGEGSTPRVEGTSNGKARSHTGREHGEHLDLGAEPGGRLRVDRRPDHGVVPGGVREERSVVLALPAAREGPRDGDVEAGNGQCRQRG